MPAHSKRLGGYGQRRIDGCRRREKAGIDDVKIVVIPCLAQRIKR